VLAFMRLEITTRLSACIVG